MGRKHTHADRICTCPYHAGEWAIWVRGCGVYVMYVSTVCSQLVLQLEHRRATEMLCELSTELISTHTGYRTWCGANKWHVTMLIPWAICTWLLVASRHCPTHTHCACDELPACLMSCTVTCGLLGTQFTSWAKICTNEFYCAIHGCDRFT
jgi:hypothetical protein